jgi:xanthosine utilization system XapX-like protein
MVIVVRYSAGAVLQIMLFGIMAIQVEHQSVSDVHNILTSEAYTLSCKNMQSGDLHVFPG